MSIVRQDVSEYDLSRPSEEQVMRNVMRTKALIEETAEQKISVSKVGAESMRGKAEPYYLKYSNANGGTTVIRMHEQQTDPLEPSKFKHRRVPRRNPSPPVPVDQSPPRDLTLEDQLNWKIPPCISNWKNSKSYAIPLEMRLTADGRHLQDLSVSDRFPKFAESLYQTERNAREEIESRAAIQRKLAVKQALKKEQEMKDIANRIRQEKAALLKDGPQKRSRSSSVEEREQARWEQKREIVREHRMERRKKRRRTDDDRDISEKIALGVAKPKLSSKFDERLYNQDNKRAGEVDSEDEYEIYDKPLFSDRASSIYRAPNSNQMKRDRPVEFERRGDIR